jgi:hypothetical protein
VPVRAHVTGSNKTHQAFGVESLFYEMDNGAWLIPNDPQGRMAPPVQRFVESCLTYQPPPAHTPDVLIAAWLAREQLRELTGDGKGGGAAAEDQGSFSASLMAR